MPRTIAVIGAGPAAYHHLSALVRSPHCDRVALAAPDTPARAALHRRFGLIKTLHDDYQELLGDSEIGIVDVCTSLVERHQIIRDALAAGKDVVTAAPFAAALPAVEELLAAAREQGRRLLPVLPQRFIPAHLRVRQLLAEGTLGAPLFAAVTRLAPESAEPGVPALLQDAYHAVELLQHLFGPAQQAAATTNPSGSIALVTLAMPEGVLGQVNVIAAATGDHPTTERRVVGTEGSLLVRDNPEDELPLIVFQGEEAYPIRLKNHPDVLEYAVLENLNHLLYCLATGETEQTTAAEALRAMRTVLCAATSSLSPVPAS